MQNAIVHSTHRGTGRILVVDDDSSLRRAIARALELEGYRVDVAEDGIEALAFFETETPTPDAVVLDVLMPRLDGFETCSRIRDLSAVPILMLTARAGVDERVEGLDVGADDYLTKPFAVAELLARVRALLRRSNASDEIIRYDDLELDPAERRALRGGRLMELTRIEFSLLELLLRNPRRVLPRAVIFEQVWGYNMEHASNSLEVYIGYLRRKLESDGEDRLIHTVRGFGYVLRKAP